jgi:NAD(P)-dependent dehydrogenase (short-subunit alcohol dehydrogenase family)
MDHSELKVAVVTGASQGIGAALVKAYRERNYQVVAAARSIELSDDPAILPSLATLPSAELLSVLFLKVWRGSDASTARQQCRNLHRQALPAIH